VLERAHVVQAIGELHQKHADVARNRDQELAEILGLLGLLRDQIEPLDLGEPINEGADLGPEELIDLGAGRVGVLDHVVQQRGDDSGVIELEIRQDRSHFEGMGEIGRAGSALLGSMRAHRINVGTVEERLVCSRVVFLYSLDELVLTHHGPHTLPASKRAPSGPSNRTRAP
jgi:hypothetical protein